MKYDHFQKHPLFCSIFEIYGLTLPFFSIKKLSSVVMVMSYQYFCSIFFNIFHKKKFTDGLWWAFWPLTKNGIKMHFRKFSKYLITIIMVILHFLASYMVRSEIFELFIPWVFHVFITIWYYGSIMVVKWHFIIRQYFHRDASFKKGLS